MQRTYERLGLDIFARSKRECASFVQKIRAAVVDSNTYLEPINGLLVCVYVCICCRKLCGMKIVLIRSVGCEKLKITAEPLRIAILAQKN